jgi:hypothetical protein
MLRHDHVPVNLKLKLRGRRSKQTRSSGRYAF